MLVREAVGVVNDCAPVVVGGVIVVGVAPAPVVNCAWAPGGFSGSSGPA